MNYKMVKIVDWVSNRIGTEVLELPKLAVEDQLNKYDETGSGLGFILLLAMTSIDEQSEFPEATHFSLISIPIVKLRGNWMTVDDENLADILAGVVRLVAPPVDEVSNGTDGTKINTKSETDPKFGTTGSGPTS